MGQGMYGKYKANHGTTPSLHNIILLIIIIIIINSSTRNSVSHVRSFSTPRSPYHVVSVQKCMIVIYCLFRNGTWHVEQFPMYNILLCYVWWKVAQCLRYDGGVYGIKTVWSW